MTTPTGNWTPVSVKLTTALDGEGGGLAATFVSGLLPNVNIRYGRQDRVTYVEAFDNVLKVCLYIAKKGTSEINVPGIGSIAIASPIERRHQEAARLQNLNILIPFNGASTLLVRRSLLGGVSGLGHC